MNAVATPWCYIRELLNETIEKICTVMSYSGQVEQIRNKNTIKYRHTFIQ